MMLERFKSEKNPTGTVSKDGGTVASSLAEEENEDDNYIDPVLMQLLGRMEERHSNRGPVIVIFNECAYTGQFPSILSSGEMEAYFSTVDDTSIKIGGKQVITTSDGHVSPLSIRHGLPYLAMHKYTREEYSNLPHVVMTSDQHWKSSILDATISAQDEVFLQQYAGERALTATEVVFREILEPLGLNQATAKELFCNGYSDTKALRDLEQSSIKSLVNGLNKNKHNFCLDPTELFVAWIEFQPLIGATATTVDWMADLQAEEKTQRRLKTLKEDDRNTAAGDLTLPEPLTTMSKFKELDKRGGTKTSLLYTIQKESAVTDTEQSGTVGPSPGWSYIQGLGSKGEVRGDGKLNSSCTLKLMNQPSFGSSWKKRELFLQSSTYSGDTKHYSFDKHKKKWYGAKEFLLRHNSFPPEDQFVTNFYPRLDIAVQLVLNEGGNMYNNSNKAVAHFSQALGIKKIQASRKGGQSNASAFKAKQGNKCNSNGNPSPCNNNGNKKQKTLNPPTFTGSLKEEKFYPWEIWITMSAAQKAQVKYLLPASKPSGNANVTSITSQDGDSKKGSAGDQFGGHTHTKAKIKQQQD
eukprot:jgi/Psemu1/17489/gm1.17489_g